MINIIAKSFSGKYGTDSNVGDIIHLQLTVSSVERNTNNKEIILVTDVSGSMETSMKEVKSSTLAFRDSLVGKKPTEMELLTPSDRDDLFRNTIDTRLITFSNEANEVWSPASDNMFEEVVVGLKSEALTNMGDALKLAFDKVDRSKFGWIIAMTDGESNRGCCRTHGSFQRLVTTTKPINTKIVTLGYGDKFDPEVLNAVGTFAYVEDSETIPIVLGNLAEEILSAVGFNCVVDLQGANLVDELTDDTLINPDAPKTTKIIAGNRVVGPLCGGKTYDILYLPHGNIQSSDKLSKFETVTVRYTDIQTGAEVVREVNIEHTSEEPAEYHRGLYYESEKKRMVYSLYQKIQTKSHDLSKVVKQIENVIEGWNEDIALEHKEELLKMIQDTKKNGHEHLSYNASAFLNRAVGSGYTNYDDGYDRGYARATIHSTQYYMASPLINNK